MTDSLALKRNFAHLVQRWNEIEERLDAGTQSARPDGLIWLHDSLDAAIRLEFSTIPPYLCALWSIKDQASPAADSIRRVVQEEMLHMALACNMLVAIGGTPSIRDPDFAPLYPGELAGGVHKGLVVRLQGLTDEALRGFMVIELPKHSVDDETSALKAYADIDQDHEGHETIGAFYDRLCKAFHRLEPDMTTDRQIAGPLAWFPVRDLTDVDEAISVIKEQGEGSPLAPGEGTSSGTGGDSLAHFYRFLEIYTGRRIEYLPEKEAWGLGETIERSASYPMAPIPAGGYPTDGGDVPDQVAALLCEFDAGYTRLLRQLDQLWRKGDQGALIQAIETMFSLQGPARALMQIPIVGNPSMTYGPCFRFQEIRSD